MQINGVKTILINTVFQRTGARFMNMLISDGSMNPAHCVEFIVNYYVLFKNRSSNVCRYNTKCTREVRCELNKYFCQMTRVK